MKARKLARVQPVNISGGGDGYDPTVRVPTRVLAALPVLDPVPPRAFFWRLYHETGEGWRHLTFRGPGPCRWDRHLDANGGLRSFIRARRPADWHRARWPTLHE